VCLITFDKCLTNVKLFHVYIKVHNTKSDIGHKPAISNIFASLSESRSRRISDCHPAGPTKCKQTDDNVTSGKSCFPFEARNGLFPVWVNFHKTLELFQIM
jgi:hypothetical protein